jgi:hypothetical glycosyl hydrolase
MDDLHLVGQKIKIIPHQNSTLNIKTGINGQSTNSGAQHFEDTNSTYIDNVLHYLFTTNKTKISFIYNKTINFYLNGKKIEKPSRLSSVYGYSRRTLNQVFSNIELQKNDVLEIETFTTIDTTNDVDKLKVDINKIIKNSHNKILKIREQKYDHFFQKHIKK